MEDYAAMFFLVEKFNRLVVENESLRKRIKELEDEICCKGASGQGDGSCHCYRQIESRSEEKNKGENDG